MKLAKLLIIITASAALCTSCSSYYSKHGQKSRHAGLMQNRHANAGRYSNNNQEPAVRTRGVNLAKDVSESDNQITEQDESAPSLTDNSDAARVRISKWQAENKCVPAKPIGGVQQHYFFGFDKSSFAQNDRTSIHNQAQYLLSHPNAKVRIEGNADDRGSREYNIALGARRAKAIIKALKEEGVPDSQCTMVSYGAEKPAAKGDNEEAYHCNRRVDVVYEVR